MGGDSLARCCRRCFQWTAPFGGDALSLPYAGADILLRALDNARDSVLAAENFDAAFQGLDANALHGRRSTTKVFVGVNKNFGRYAQLADL
jgi:hypothetical protein